MTDKPKVMFNQGEGKFTAMDPKDDNLVNKIYNSKDPVKEVDKLVNETKPASSVEEFYKQQSILWTGPHILQTRNKEID